MAFWLMPQWHSSMMRGGILANRRLLEDKIHGCFVHKDSHGTFFVSYCWIFILPWFSRFSKLPHVLLHVREQKDLRRVRDCLELLRLATPW